MRIPVLICLLALLLLPPSKAGAETIGVFLLDNFRHWLEFTYQYDGLTSYGRNSTGRRIRQHRFEESYNIAADYALYDPQILKGTVESALTLGQEETSRIEAHSGDQVALQYNIDGIIFERKPYPMTFFTRSERLRVRREFSRGYTLDIDSSGAGIRLRNKILPTRFNYVRSASKTAGLEVDRKLVTDRLSVGATRTHSETSATEFYFVTTEEKTSLEDGSSSHEEQTNELSVRNIFAWGENRRYSLLSQYRFRDEQGRRDEQIHELQESLSLGLGRALDAGVDYGHEERTIFDQGERRDSIHLWIQHKILNNFRTRLSLRARQADLVNGEETDASGLLVIGYNKRLPFSGNLHLDLSQGYGITDRNFSDSRVSVFDEPHTARLVTPTVLVNVNVIPETVRVRSADLDIEYTEGESNDYVVRQAGAVTEIIIVPGNIGEGDELLISYDFIVNPSVKFSSDSTGIAFSLAFLDNRYRVYGSWNRSEQHLLEGEDDLLQMVRQRTYIAGAEAAHDSFNYGAEYFDYWSTIDKRQSVDFFSRFSRQFERNSFSVHVRDRISRYETTSRINLVNNSYSDNIFNIGGAYSRFLFNSGMITATGNYINSSGGTLDRDDISAGLNYQVRYGRFVLSLRSQVVFRYFNNSGTRDDYLRLDITRYL